MDALLTRPRQLVLGGAALALVATYVGLLGRHPLRSEPLFSYAALLSFAAAVAVGIRLVRGRPAAVAGFAPRPLATATAVAGWASAVVAHVVTAGSAPWVVVISLATVAVVLGSARLDRAEQAERAGRDGAASAAG